MPSYIIFIILILIIFEIICTWITYEKAGVPGWKSIVPVYNILVLFQLANIPMWMFLLFFIPVINLYPIYLVFTSLVERLGKKKIYGILLIVFPFIMYPILAFSKSNVKSTYMNLEDDKNESSALMDGPIEPLGAMPDIGEKEETIVEEITNDLNETTSSIETPNVEEPYLEPLEPMIPVHVESPLTAQQKGQHVEEKKEVFPDVNVFKTCPYCGTKVEPTATACFLCGKKFDQ